MITKIDIEKFGLFNNYRWSQSIGNDNNVDLLKKVNMIYGRNYSGKTTLSRILRCVEKKQLHEKYTDGKFTIIDDHGNSITQSNLNFSEKIRVYNTDFVKDNLSWLHDDINGDIKPFTLLGSGNIEAMARIEAINTELGSIDAKEGLLYQEDQSITDFRKEEATLKEKQEQLTDALTRKANKELKLNDYFVKQGDTYNIRNIQSEVDEILSSSKDYSLDENAKELHKKIIKEEEKNTITEVSITRPKLQEYVLQTKTYVEKKITISSTIQDLLNNSILQEWVNKGREYHKEQRNTCAFCGGIITTERWNELDAHFSKESEELKYAIQEEIKRLNDSKTSLDDFLLKKGLIKENYYSTHHSRYDEIREKWDVIVKRYKEIILALIEKLQERHDDIFNPKVFDEQSNINKQTVDDISDGIVGILELFNKLSKDNDEKSKSLATDKDKSRKILRYSEIQNFITILDYKTKIEDINTESGRLDLKKKEMKLLREKVSQLEIEKKQRELELNDEGEAAKKVNNHLSDFFGHDGLKLKPETLDTDEPKTSFVIMRGSEKAHNLSEGECSLISFCYFIAKMEDELKSTDCDKLIIYIDDPISSLDSNHIFFMYSLIDTVIAKEKKYGQLFISTHNLDFLKYLKRLTIPYDEKNKPLANHFIVEKKKKDNESKCELKLMPTYLKDYVTEYNFLFKEIYNMAKPFENGDRARFFENQFTHFYNLPNNMRKFLECYLFYRYPNTDDPLKNISKLFTGHIPSLVNRVINEYSHLTWGERGTLVMDVQEAESVAKDILNAIKTKDREHFNALCNSIGVDENIEL